MSTVIKVNGINIHYKTRGPRKWSNDSFLRPAELANVLGKIASTNHEY